MSRLKFPVLLTLLVLVLPILFAACNDDDDDQEAAATTPAAAPLSGDITVFAAASLNAAFTEIGDAFSEANPDATVDFNFAGSQDLRTQLEQGASADVFASADTKQMDMAVTSGVVADESTIFAHNRLVVIPNRVRSRANARPARTKNRWPNAQNSSRTSSAAGQGICPNSWAVCATQWKPMRQKRNWASQPPHRIFRTEFSRSQNSHNGTKQKRSAQGGNGRLLVPRKRPERRGSR